MIELPRAFLQPVRRAAGALNLPLLVANPFATRRAPLHAPDFPLVLLFTEKAGCTSLTKWFLFQIGRLDAANAFHPSVHEYRKSVLNTGVGYGWEGLRLIVSGEKQVVKLVRNPYDRAASSFLQTLGNARAENADRWGSRLVSAARRRAGRPPSVTPALSFRQFVHYLATTGTERGRINGHVARQHVASEDGRISRIIKLERFSEEIRQLEAEHALARSPLDMLTFSRHHRSIGQQPSRPGVCGPDVEITGDQVRQRHLPAYDTLYDEDTRRGVREAFAVDFRAYGYDP